MPKLTLSFKGRVLDVFHIHEGETLIGRDPDCEITIDSLAVAPINVSVKLENHACRLENLDESFPVLVNHSKKTKARLNHADVIQVGKHTLSFSEDSLDLAGNSLHREISSAPEDSEHATETEQKGIPQGMLQIMNGEKFGRIIPLNRNMTRIGRTGEHCAMISRRDSGYYISFLEGPSPPIINKIPLGHEAVLLTDGDMIEVGSTQLQFHT